MAKRSKTKHPALKKNKNTKVRQELIDYDYLDKLSPEEKDWLNKFTEEYVCGSFIKNNNGTYSKKKNLHKTKEQRNDSWTRNNKRNNDTYSVCKVMNMMKDSEDLYKTLEVKSVRTSSLSRGYT